MAELLVVATPIGNLSDLTPHMAEAFTRADLIAAEDTRVTMKLLHHLGLSRKMVSCHRHNEAARADELMDRVIREDLVLAYASDAGTPGISDPGAALVRAARRAGIGVTPICGPSALTAALSVSGFDLREFIFVGFLPREKKILRKRLEALRESGVPVCVAYESPRRVLGLLEAICGALPGCRVCVCCDLSKRYERILSAPCERALEQMRVLPNAEKGEYVLALDMSEVPPIAKEPPRVSAAQALLGMMLDGLSLDEAAKRALEQGYARNEVYQEKLRIKRRFDA